MLYKNYVKKMNKTSSRKIVTNDLNEVNMKDYSYREVSDLVTNYFAKVSFAKSFFVRKKIGMIPFTYEISYMNDSYTLRQGQNIISESRLVSTILTRLFEEVRNF